MGQPAVPVGTSASPFGRPPATGDRTGSPLNRASAIRTAAGAGANEANGTGPSMVAVPGLDEEALAALLHEPEGTPSWDRRPLFIVIVSAVVLVLIGVAVGFAVAAFGPRSDATWREGTPGPHSSAHSAPLTRGGTSRP
jgi:hypothetical protein